VEKLLQIPPEVLSDLLDREIEALDRLVDEALERNLVKKPCQRVELEEVRIGAHA
jgi:hypothetical protein